MLSIVIPSNNKTSLLEEAINSILSEAAFKNNCEICISDNSSNDNTEHFIASKYSSNDRILYRRSVDTPLMDENINMVAKIATEEYIWFFGDDDLIVPGFLSELIYYIQTKSPDLLIINSKSFKNNKIIEKSRVPELNTKIYGPYEDDLFLEDLGGYLTYIGGIIIKKQLWREYFRPVMIGTYFAHVDTVLRAKHGRSAHYLAQPGICMRLDTQTWTSRHFEIWNVYFPAVIWALEDYSDRSKFEVIPRHPIKSLNRIVASRAYGRFNLDVWQNILTKSKVNSNLNLFISLVVAIIPRELFRLLYIFFIRIRRNKQDRKFSPELALAQLEKTKS